MQVITAVKAVSNIAVSVGVSSIVGNAIKMTTPSDVKTVKKVCMMFGGFVLSSMVSDAAAQYTDATIDGAYKGFTEAREATRAKKDETLVVNEESIPE